MTKSPLLRSLWLLLALLPLTLSAQKATLSGTLSGLPDEVHILVATVNGSQLQLVDTLRLDAKGRYRFAADVAQPTMFIFQTDNRDGAMLHLLLAPQDKVAADLLYLPERHAFKITSCKGSDNVDLYRQFNDILLSAVNQTTQALIPGQVEELLRQHKNTLVAAFLVTFFEQDLDNHALLYTEVRDALAPRYPADPFVQHLSDKLKGLLVAGMEAPEIAMSDPYGNTRRLSDLRGHVVLIDFWASWCSPCRRENPNVVRLYQKYHDRGFEIYSVSLDKAREPWLKAIADDHLDWPNHVSDLQGWTSAGGAAYGIMSVPSTVLVGPDGKIIARNLRGSDLERKLDEIYK